MAAGRRADAERTLEQAVLSFPGDPRTWLRLTRLELSLGRPREADRIVRGALYLDPFSREARTLYVSARSGDAPGGRPGARSAEPAAQITAADGVRGL